MRFRCKNGHEFNQMWITIKGGSFCKECTYSRKRQSETIPKIQQYCQQHDITMTGEYRKAKDSMEWLCNRCGEQFTDTWDNLRSYPHRCDQSDSLAAIQLYCQKHDIIMVDDADPPARWRCQRCKQEFTKQLSELKLYPHQCQKPNALPKVQQYCQDNNLTMQGGYRNARTRIGFRCNQCNAEFSKTWDCLRVHPHQCC